MEIAHIGLLLFRHVVDVAHVGIELCLQAKIAQHPRKQHNRPYYASLALQRNVGETGKAIPRLCLDGFHHVGKIDEHQEDGAHQEERTEEPQVAQCYRLQRNQRQKGAHSGHVADEQRRGNFLKCTANGGGMGQVGDEMQGIVDGNAQDDRRDANDNHRNVIVNQRQAPHGKQPSPSHSQDNEEQVFKSPEGEEKQHGDEEDGQCHRQEAIGLDLCSVSNGNHRSACQVHFERGLALLYLGRLRFEQGDELCIVLRFARAKGRLNHHNGPFHIG